jgi:hypothetical protein
MPKRNYATEKGGPKNLEISWKGMWKEISVKVNGSEIGTMKDQKELQEGKEFKLPGGGTLSVKLVKKLFAPELQILKNGEPLAGSDSDPKQKLKIAYGVIFFIAGLNIVLGLIAELGQVDILLELGIGYFSIIFGAIFGVLGYFVKEKSVIALWIAIVLFVIDTLLSMYFAIEMGASPSTSSIIVKIFLFVGMIQGFRAIKALNNNPQTAI